MAFPMGRQAVGKWLATVFALTALLLAGCPGEPAKQVTAPPAKEKAKTPLTVLIVDDPQLGQAIEREWRSRTEEDLAIQNVTAEQVATAHRLPGDAIIFPAGLLGQLAERNLILPIESAALEAPAFGYRDIFEQIRRQEMRWAGKTMAVPLGSPQFLLAYRADIFAELKLAPPVDWAAYEEAVARLTNWPMLDILVPPAEVEAWQAASEPLAEGWAGQLLLARAASYALHRDQVSPLFQYDTLAPLIDQPPYAKALEELVAAAKVAGFAKDRLTPDQALAKLRSGGCAMAITWPAPSSAGVEQQGGKETKARIGFTLLPGSRQAYRFATKTWEERASDESVHVPLMLSAGRLAGVTGTTASPARAQGFILWLAGRDVSNIVGPRSTAVTLFRESQVADAVRWAGGLEPVAAREYGETLAKAQSLPRVFPALRLPGQAEYLAALDSAVVSAVTDKTEPAAALGKAAKKWQEISEKLDVSEQRKANAHSLSQ